MRCFRCVADIAIRIVVVIKAGITIVGGGETTGRDLSNHIIAAGMDRVLVVILMVRKRG